MNILELDSYNLGDAVKFNTRLNPKIWDADETMRPEVRDRLLEIAQDFREFLGITDLQLKDITVSGSNAAYTYTPHSDIDLHLVVDLPEAEVSEVYRELFDAKKYQYNEQHNIKIGGYDVELYVQDANKPHNSQGIYSVANNKWTDVPKRRKPTVDDISTRSKYEDLGQRIDSAIASNDYDIMTAMTAKIRDMRQAGLDQHGEFGPENLAFKMLRTQGKIKELYDARNRAKDELLSLDERRKSKKKKRVKYGFGGYWYPGTGYAGQDTAAAQDAGGDGGGGESIREDVEPSDEEILKDFVKFCVAELKIKSMPTVKLRRDPQWSVVNRTFGRYIDDAHLLEVAFGQRHIMDVLRTVAHELTHTHQHERETVPSNAGETGSEYENEANARAGILMRDYASLHPEFFAVGQTKNTKMDEGASGYIPTKKQAKDPRFSMALTQDIRPGQVGKEANKLKLKTNSQGQPQIAQANGLYEQLMLELQLSKEGIQAPVDKAKDSEQYYRFIMAKHKLGRPLTRQEQEFVRTYKMFGNQQIAESEEQLDEVKMSPSALQQWANSDAAKGIRAGFEAELIFRDTTNDDDDDMEMEPDYDYDERARSVQGVIDFFQGGDYGGMSQREENRLQEGLDNQYLEWMDERLFDTWRDERDDLIREAWLREKTMTERVHDYLVEGMEMDDREADRIQAVGEAAPRFTKSSDQEAYKQANPDYATYLEAEEGAEAILEEDVEQTISKEDGFYDEVLDEFRENFYVDDDSSFFQDVGLSYMSDIAAEYSLDWPYLTGGGGGNNGGSREWDEIGSSLEKTVGMPVKVSTGYHNAKRKEGQWIVEPDSSLSPDDREDMGLEIVSPPMPLLTALEQLQAVTDWANSSEGNAYTNQSTGLHMGVSVPYKGGDVDYLKLILFLGDEYVLQSFGREANTYTKSAMSKFRENIKGGRADPAGALMLMKNNLIEFAQREIQKGVGTGKYTSAHIQDGYIEFRSAGGDWLAEESADPQKLSSTMLRYARAMQIAADPSAERREFAKKLYKLVAPEGDSQLALFSQFASGEITAEQLKKRWAEKTIGAERKMNQRWKLYNRATGEPVPGQEYNGYTEEEARARAKEKISPGSSDQDFDRAYELRNIGEEQQWEVYDVNTGKTLEIVKGRNKGEAADSVFDKYAAQKIGFNVRPYEDPDTMTPRAKLAKRIATKKPEPKQVANQATNERGVPYWEIYSIKDDWNVIHTFLSDTAADAKVDGANWLTSIGAKHPEAFAVRPKIKNTQVKDIAPDVAQNFAQPQQARASNGVPAWEIYERESGHVINTIFDHDQTSAWQQAQLYLRDIGAEQPNLFSLRPKMAQNFDSARDSSTLQTNLQDRSASSAQTANRSWGSLDEYNWNITNRDTGETLYRINSANRQAAAEYALNYLRNQGLNSSDYQIVIAGLPNES